MRALVLVAICGVASVGCEIRRSGRADTAGGAEAGNTGSNGSAQDTSEPASRDGDGSAGPNGPGPGGSDSGGSGTDGSSEGGGACQVWSEARADLREGSWSGRVVGCVPGDLDAGGRQRALRLINAYRALAKLSPVTTSSARDANAQACALLMTANGALSHNPPADWACRSAAAVKGAGSSNIATAPAVRAVDLYMIDHGNETTLGHRRWLLSNQLGPIGIGSTDGSSCVWVFEGEGKDKAKFTAFPPAGDVPLELFDNLLGWPSAPRLDDVGWSVQSDTITLTKAKVTVTRGGAALPVEVTVLSPGYGSSSAIAFRPKGWSTTAGSYDVSLEGISPPIHYTVNVLACP